MGTESKRPALHSLLLACLPAYPLTCPGRDLSLWMMCPNFMIYGGRVPFPIVILCLSDDDECGFIMGPEMSNIPSRKRVCGFINVGQG